MSEKTKILIVDDEPQILELLAEVLTTSGFEVLKAHNGNEAIDMTKQKRPDFIVLDLSLPKLDGFQVCAMIRQDPQNDSIPLMILTGKFFKESDIVKSLEAGADDYVTKPFAQEELLRKVRNLLSQAKTGDLPSYHFKNKGKKK